MKTFLRAVVTGFGLKAGADLYRVCKKQLYLLLEDKNEDKEDEEEEKADSKDFIEPKQEDSDEA